VVALVALAGSARADGNPFLDQARAQIDQLEFDQAGESLQRALTSGTSGPTELAEIYRLSGEVAVAVGDSAGAEQHFARLLVIAPETQLRAGVSPKITAAFEAAAAAQQGKRISIESATAPGSITLVVGADPLDLITGARVDYTGDDGAPHSIKQSGKFRIKVGLGEVPVPHRVVLSAVDQYGNRLATLGSMSEPIAVPAAGQTPSRPVATRPRRTRSFLGRGWLWAGIAVAAAGSGIYFGLQAKSAEDDLAALSQDSMNHSFSEAQEVEDRARRDALIANISFGVAGGFAILATVLFLRGDPAQPAEDSALLVPRPTRHGGAVDLVLRY